MDVSFNKVLKYAWFVTIILFLFRSLHIAEI